MAKFIIEDHTAKESGEKMREIYKKNSYFNLQLHIPQAMTLRQEIELVGVEELY